MTPVEGCPAWPYATDSYGQRSPCERKFSIAERIARIALVIFAVLAILPAIIFHRQMAQWWREATGDVTSSESLREPLSEPSRKKIDVPILKGTPYSAIQRRRYPPLSQVDTVRGSKSVHSNGTEKFFKDADIVKKEPVVGRDAIGDNICVYYTHHRKAILLQQAIRGCTAAAAGMLILDQGGSIASHRLWGCNLGTTESQMGLIRESGLEPLITKAKTLAELRVRLLESGPASISIGGEIGGHQIVVDAVSEDLKEVRLRDPFHGWEITVTSEAFLRRGPGLEELLHVRKRST